MRINDRSDLSKRRMMNFVIDNCYNFINKASAHIIASVGIDNFRFKHNIGH